MTAPRTLTEAFVRSLPPAPARTRVAISDALVPGLRVKVTDTGAKSFILWKRYGNAKHPAARSLGAVGELSLTQAREKARSWIALIKAGEDPRGDATTGDAAFGVILEKFIAAHVAKQRQAAGVERLLRKELLSRWRNKPLASVTKADVIQIIDEINGRGAPYQARALLRQVKVFFGWAVERGHLETSVADRLKASRLIGKASARQRVLSDIEIAAFWRAARRMPYPNGPLFQMLLLVGQRRSEVAEARWSEFDLPNRVWTIPPERFKTEQTHTVPLSPDVMTLLKTLPRWKGGDFLFSSTGGKKPVNGFSKAKRTLDCRMLRSLKAIARKRRDDPSTVELPPFVLHDLRRSVRTRLSSLRIADVIAEQVIGHGRKGIQKVYDQHQYLPEMREALDRWATLLRGIVAQPASKRSRRKGVKETPKTPTNVVPLRGVR
jgi:integrase